MVKRCKSMFLGIKLLEDDLRGGKNFKQLQRTIDEAPDRLENIYDRNWERITNLREHSRCRAFAILRWTAFSPQPLTVAAITEALFLANEESDDLSCDELPDSIDDVYVKTEISDLCGSLVEIRKAESDTSLGIATLHLAHFSVRQYILCHMLSSTGELIGNERLRLAHEAIQKNVLVKTCLRYLDSPRASELELSQTCLKTKGMVSAFRQYATWMWFKRIQRNVANSKEIISLANRFFRTRNQNWERWREDLDTGIINVVTIQHTAKIKSGNRLFYASLIRCLETVTYLLDEMRLDVNHGDESKRTALFAASFVGWTHGVAYLLRGGADVTMRNNKGLTALDVAACHASADMAKLIIEKGAITMAKGGPCGDTPLHRASMAGSVEVTASLLDMGVDPNAWDKCGYTPLHNAAITGNDEVAKQLIESGDDIEATAPSGFRPLSVASLHGSVNIAKVLLDKGTFGIKLHIILLLIFKTFRIKFEIIK